jgi:nucleoside-diphosphate-sugar epimerase
VAQSVAFLYAPEGGPLKDEQARPWTDAPAPFDRAVAALLELERTVTGEAGLEGLILRYGALYGPGTWYARDGDIAEQVRRRRFPLIGDGGGLISWLHVEDAAAATVRAVQSGASGIYTWSTTSRSAIGSGCPSTRGSSAPGRPGGCRLGWRSWWPALWPCRS